MDFPAEGFPTNPMIMGKRSNRANKKLYALNIINIYYEFLALSMKFTIIYGSYRTGRRGIKAAKYIMIKVKERGHDAVLLDAKELDLPMLERMYSEYENPPENMKKAAEQIKDSDGTIIVSGEYNHSLQPGLKNLMDHFMQEYFWKPSAIVSYSKGSFGGQRSAVHMRAVLGELGTPSIPSMFPVPNIDDAFDEEGNALDKAYDKRIKRFLDELEWYAEALKEQREKGVPY